MNHQNQQNGMNTKTKINLKNKLMLAGIALLLAVVCNSCDPNDDDTGTDGTSGATSSNLTTPKQSEIQFYWNC